MTKRPPKAYVEEKLDFLPTVRDLIKKGRVHGFITAKEILQAAAKETPKMIMVS